MSTQEKQGLSALDKARALKERMAEEKRKEEESSKLQEADAVKNLHSRIAETQEEILRMEQEKESLSGQVEGHKKERKGRIATIRAAIKEMVASPETKELIKDESIKQEILGEDEAQLAEARLSQKDREQQIADLTVRIEGKKKEMETLTRETPEWKAEQERLRAEGEKARKLEIAKKILREQPSLYDFEKDKYHEKRIVSVDTERYKRLTPEEKSEAVESLTLAAQNIIDREINERLAKSGVIEREEAYAKIDAYNAERVKVRREVDDFHAEWQTMKKEFVDTIKMLREKGDAGDDQAVKIIQGISRWGNDESFVLGSQMSVLAPEIAREFGRNFEAAENYTFDPSAISEYVAATRNHGRAMLDALKAENVPEINAVHKQRVSEPERKRLISSNAQHAFEKKGTMESLRAEDKAKRAALESYRGQLLAIAKNEAEQAVFVGEMRGLPSETNEHRAYNSVEDLKTDMEYLANDIEKAKNDLYTLKATEAKYAGRENEPVILHANGAVEFVHTTDLINQAQERIAGLEQELKKSEQQKRELMQEGYAQNILQKLKKISKEDYDTKMQQIESSLAGLKTALDQEQRTKQSYWKDQYVEDEYSQKKKNYLDEDHPQPATLGDYFSMMESSIGAAANRTTPKEKKEALMRWSSLEKEGKDLRRHIAVPQL